MSSHFATIKSYLPHIKSPLIVNGPMATFAGPALATAVAKAGGHGQIGTLNDAALLERQLTEVRDTLTADPNFSFDASSSTATLPVGIGFLVFKGNLEVLLPVVQKHRPAVLWMFAAPTTADYTTWAHALRQASPQSKIWIQAGSVATALEVAGSTSPADVLVMQGSDAGGHGYEKGSGTTTLVPETIDALAAAGHAHLPVLASGGVVDGRGVAAALALGAAGVVMGTRFLAAEETTVHPGFRARVLSTRDGGQTTVRHKVFDQLRGPNEWPVEYDGRGLRSASYHDFVVDGHDIDEVRRRWGEAVRSEHAGFASASASASGSGSVSLAEGESNGEGKGEGKAKDKKESADKGGAEQSRAVIWMGTGVGLVRRVQSAAEIVQEVREGAKRALDGAAAKL